MIKNILRETSVLALAVLKGDPVKAAIYEGSKILLIWGLTRFKDSTKNELDDKLLNPVIAALKTKVKK